MIPAVRFARDAYLNFCRQRPWQESVCSSPPSFSPPSTSSASTARAPPVDRTDGLQTQPRHPGPPRREQAGPRLLRDTPAPRSSRRWTSLKFKLDILWSMNDAMALRYGLEGKLWGDFSRPFASLI